MRAHSGEGVVAQVKQYTAVAERGEKYWVVTVPELDRVTQARRLADVEPMARDLISLMEDVPADSFKVKRVVRVPLRAEEHIKKARQLRAEELSIRANAARESRLAAQALAAQHMSLKEIGEVLDVSYQRAGQLVNGK